MGDRHLHSKVISDLGGLGGHLVMPNSRPRPTQNTSRTESRVALGPTDGYLQLLNKRMKKAR